jgi:hypothetical protein
MMKKNLLIISLLMLSFDIFSQTQQFFDSPFGGGGGFTPGWSFVKVNSLNNMLSLADLPQVSKSGIFTTGGAGFIYIGFIPGLRIGGMGFGGSTSSKSTSNYFIPNDPVRFNTESIYTFGEGGFTIEYTFPFVKSFGVSAGITIGGGSITVELYKNHYINSWGGISDEFRAANSIPYDMHRTLKNSFWIISPTLNVDIPFYRFLCLRIGTGYNLTLGEKWKLDNDINISGVPSDFNGRNFFIQTGIFIGFFSF